MFARIHLHASETEFLYDSRRLFMRFAQLERAHCTCACTDVRVTLSLCSFCTDTATGKNSENIKKQKKDI